MAVQNYMVGVFFAVGVVTGLIVSLVTIQTAIESNMLPMQYKLQEMYRPLLKQRVDNSSTPRSFAEPMTHEELKSMESPVRPINFDDGHVHNDKTFEAVNLYHKVRVLCWVMTTSENHKEKAIHVKATWGKRCNLLLFMSDAEDAELPATKLKVLEGREHLTAKTMQAFDMVYAKYLNDYDWFIKADDDTYIIVENLRYMLSSYSPEEPIYFGHHFQTIIKQGYFSGGGGYAVSRESLRRFGGRSQNLCADDHGAEDVAFGQCMEYLKVKTGDSRDVLGRTRFHCFNPETHLHGGYPDWYYKYDKYGAKKGMNTISDYAVTFHYISTNQMYELEFYVYHLRPFGIHNGGQDLNRHNMLLNVTSAPTKPETLNKTEAS